MNMLPKNNVHDFNMFCFRNDPSIDYVMNSLYKMTLIIKKHFYIFCKDALKLGINMCINVLDVCVNGRINLPSQVLQHGHHQLFQLGDVLVTRPYLVPTSANI